MASNALAVRGGYGGMRRSVGRDVFGRFANRTRRFGGEMVSRGAAASAALARTGERDTLGGVVARNVGTGAVALGMGVLDGSSVGSFVNGITGGWLDPSTAVGLLAGVVHGTKLDGFVHPGLRKMNRTLLSGIIPIWLYKRGLGVPDIIGGRFKAGVTGVEDVSAQRVEGAAADVEPIPGEATVS